MLRERGVLNLGGLFLRGSRFINAIIIHQSFSGAISHLNRLPFEAATSLFVVLKTGFESGPQFS